MKKRKWVVIYTIEGKIRHDIVVAETLRQVADNWLIAGEQIPGSDIVMIVEASGVGASALEVAKDKLNYGVITIDAASSEANKGDVGFEYADTLLSCPFCGSHAEFEYSGLDGMGYARCTNILCGAQIFEDKDSAVELWNSRRK